MFFHNVRHIAAGFALAAVAVTIGATANSAHAERRKADQHYNRCGDRDGCKHQHGGIVQKKRDGVNYFYGGSDLPYRHARRDKIYAPVGAPYQVIQYISYGYSGSCGAKWSKSWQLCCNEKQRLFNPAIDFYNPYPFPTRQCW